LHDLVTKLPGKTERGTTTAKQDDDDDTDDESGFTLLGLFGGGRGNRHFVHDFFSFVMG
jgi:hypothetical protein